MGEGAPASMQSAERLARDLLKDSQQRFDEVWNREGRKHGLAFSVLAN